MLFVLLMAAFAVGLAIGAAAILFVAIAVSRGDPTAGA
jgi:hypothetical protein